MRTTNGYKCSCTAQQKDARAQPCLETNLTAIGLNEDALAVQAAGGDGWKSPLDGALAKGRLPLVIRLG